MGVNINYSLVMEGADRRFIDSELFYSPVQKSFYLEALTEITEIKEELYGTLREFYIASSNQVLNERGLSKVDDVVKTIWAKASDLFAALLRGLARVRDFIVGLIDKFLKRSKESAKKDEKDLKAIDTYKKIVREYTPDIYFDMDMRSNMLTQKLTDSRWPSPTAIEMKSVSEVLDGLDAELKKTNGNFNQAKVYMTNIISNVNKKRIEIRRELLGKEFRGDTESDADFEDFVKFNIAGSLENRKITMDIATRAHDNLEKYDKIFEDFTKIKSEVTKSYNTTIHEIETLKSKAQDRVLNPQKYAYTKGPTGTYFPGEVSEQYIGMIATYCVSIYDVVSKMINDQVKIYGAKLQTLEEMRVTDKRIVKMVLAAIDAKEEGSLTECVYNVTDDPEYRQLCREAEDNLEQFVEGCLQLRQLNAQRDAYRVLSESRVVYLNEATIMERIDQLIQMVVQMFKRFVVSIQKLGIRDKKWFEENAKTILAADFKFPNQDLEIGKWYSYNIDLISKSSNVPVFDTTNTEIMNALADDDAFAKYIFTKLGTSETAIKSDDAKNGNFAKKCEAVFADGGEEKTIKISEVQGDKDKMFKYCQDYIEGEGGSIYKAISQESKVLDESKKTVMRAIKTHQTSTSQNNQQDTQQNAEQKTATTQTDTQKATTGASTQQTASNNANAQASSASTQTAAKESSDIDIAKIFGIRENPFLLEIDLPNTGKADKSAVDNNISAGGGDDENKLKELRVKANRFFTMYGNLLGAKMTSSMKCYKQYMQLFKWALNSNKNRTDANTETLGTGETSNDKPIADQAKEQK